MEKIKRKHLRFDPDALIALIDFDSEGDFEPKIAGLVLNESHGGCAMVALNHERITPQVLCRIKVGKLSILNSEICWTKAIDSKIIRVGIQYLE